MSVPGAASQRILGLQRALRESSDAARAGGAVARPAPLAPRMPAAQATAAPAAPVATPPAPAGLPANAVTVMRDGGKFYLVDASSAPIAEVVKVGPQDFALPDGTRVSLGDDGASLVVTPSDITDTGVAGASDANLDNSAVDLGPREGGGRVGAGNPGKQKKRDSIGELAASIRQQTAEQPTGEAVAGLKSLQKKVAKLTAEQRTDLLEKLAGLDSLGRSAGDARRAELLSDAERRLVRLEEMSGVSDSDRAAATIDTAARSRAEANTPRPAPAGREAAVQDIAAARELVAESLPEGDLAALTEALRQLPPERQQAVLSRMSPDTRALVSRLVSPDATPNDLAAALRPVNAVDEMFMELDSALRAGDVERADAIRSLLADQNAASAEDFAVAQRAFQSRYMAADDLRRQIIGSDPLYEEQAARLQSASVPPPQPTVIPAGARTPEFATEEVAPGALPGMAEDSAAAARESELLKERRAPGGGRSLKDRLDAIGLAEGQSGELPFGLRGADGNRPFESRSRGERGVDTRDVNAIEKARKLQADIDAAQKAVDSLPEGTKRIAAMQKLRQAYAAMDEAFPPRVVNDRTGAVVTGESGPQSARDLRVERGRKAYSDSSVNRPGSQENYDEHMMTLAGFRPRPKRNISRSNAAMSAGDEGRLSDEALEAYGGDFYDLMRDVANEDVEFDPRWAVDPTDLTESGPVKKGRLGGRQQQSRTEQALESMFGGVNPLRLKVGENKAPLYANSRALAEDMMSRQTIFKPGTDNWEMAVDRVSQLIDRKYNLPEVVGDKKPTATSPQAAPDPAPVPAASQPEGGTPQASAADGSDKLEQSAVELATPAGAVKTMEQIQKEASAVEKKKLRQYKKSGMTDDEAREAANADRLAYVNSELAKRDGMPRSDGTVATDPASRTTEASAAADAPAPADTATPSTDPPASAADDAAPATPDASGGGAGDPPDTTPRMPEPDGDMDGGAGTGVTDKVVVRPKRRLPRWLIAAGAVGGGLAYIGSQFGGGGGGGGGGGDTPFPRLPPRGGPEAYPIPPGGDAARPVMVDQEIEEADRLQRILDRVRSGSAAEQPAYQTVLSYNQWG